MRSFVVYVILLSLMNPAQATLNAVDILRLLRDSNIAGVVIFVKTSFKIRYLGRLIAGKVL